MRLQKPDLFPGIPAGTFTGYQGKNHIQGMAVDEKKGVIYYSFTTKLIKTDFSGRLLGSVTDLAGHLGCIAFNEADGCVYGSLEYKNDVIGAGILRSVGKEGANRDGFYVAVFRGDAVDRADLSAERDGVMTAAFLPGVLADYEGAGENGAPHRYGCSGIDGLCFAPTPGGDETGRFLYVAYGVYGDVSRTDNDHQILLCLRPEAIRAAAKPLSEAAPHQSAPKEPGDTFFVYTGNTEYGVQNLEYDPGRRLLLMAVYRGKKPAFPNFDFYAADLSAPAAETPLRGLSETGKSLTLFGAPAPESDRITGWRLPFGQYGIHAKYNGGFYIAEPESGRDGHAARVYTYDFDPATGFTKR